MVRLNEIKKIAMLKAGETNTNKKGLEGELKIGALTAGTAASGYDGFWVITHASLAFSEIDKIVFELQELKSDIAAASNKNQVEPKSN